MSGSGISQGLQGESTVVEVAPGKYLFALLGGAQEIAVRTFYDRLPKNDALARQQAISELREARDVPRDYYPMLVTFSSINDPKTVREVKPDQFSSIFGPGYSLKSITLEITDEPVTEGRVEAMLGWISTLKGRLKPIREPIPTNYKPEPVEELYSNSFVRGN